MFPVGNQESYFADIAVLLIVMTKVPTHVLGFLAIVFIAVASFYYYNVQLSAAQGVAPGYVPEDPTLPGGTGGFLGGSSASPLSWTGGPESVPMDGYAWSATVGWISFNCETGGWNDLNANNMVDSGEIESVCADSDYGVEIKNDGTLNGFAWSDHVGWVQFGDPDDDGPLLPLSDFPDARTEGAYLDINASDEIYVHGWARVCSATDDGDPNTAEGDCSSMDTDPQTGGWDGWISFDCDDASACATSNYSLKVIEQTAPVRGEFSSIPEERYIWGSDSTVGWIDMTEVIFEAPFTPGFVSCESDPGGPVEILHEQDMWGQDIETDCIVELGEYGFCSVPNQSCEVQSPPVLISFEAETYLIRAGDSTTLEWEVQNADECYVLGPGGVQIAGDESTNGLTGGDDEPVSTGSVSARSEFLLVCDPVNNNVFVPVGDPLTIQVVADHIEI